MGARKLCMLVQDGEEGGRELSECVGRSVIIGHTRLTSIAGMWDFCCLEKGTHNTKVDFSSLPL